MLSNILAISSIILILLFAYLKKQLTLVATITAFLVGIILYFCGGWLLLTALYTFFVSAVIASNIKKSYKKKTISGIHEKTGKRDFVQVIANSLIAVILAIVYFITKEQILLIAVLIAFACYNADSWASELGIISKKNPRFILGFKKAQKGVSGAVTLLGIVYSILGSLIIAILYFLFKGENIYLVILISLYGFLGAIMDSVLGQVFQALYYDEENKKYTEKKDGNKKVKGYSIINNDTVNFLAPLISVTIYILISLF